MLRIINGMVVAYNNTTIIYYIFFHHVIDITYKNKKWIGSLLENIKIYF